MASIVSRVDRFTYLSTEVKPTDVPAHSILKESDTGDTYEFSGSSWVKILSNGAIKVLEQGSANYPQFQGLDVSISMPTAVTYVLNSVQAYHYGELAINIAGTDTLLIQARYADQVTVGTLDAIGPTGAAVVLNATQLVAANNGRYRLTRFDATDLIFVKTGTGASTVIGRLGSA